MNEYCTIHRPPYWNPPDYNEFYKEEKTVNVTVDGTDFKITIASREIVPNKVYEDVLKSAAKQIQIVSKANANNKTNSGDYCSNKERGVAVQINGTIFMITIQCATEKTLSTEEYITALKKATEKIDEEPTTTQIFSSLLNSKPGENPFSETQIVEMIEALSQKKSKEVQKAIISFIIARYLEIISEKNVAMLRGLIEPPKDNSEAMGDNSNTGKGIDDR